MKPIADIIAPIVSRALDRKRAADAAEEQRPDMETPRMTAPANDTPDEATGAIRR